MPPRKRQQPQPGPSVALDAPAAAPDPGPDTPAVTLRIKTGPQLRKKDFLDRVTARSGLPRGQARIAVEATLAELAAVLLAEEEANLPPLGKLKVTRSKDNGRNRVLMVKLVVAPDSGHDSGTEDGGTDDSAIADAALGDAD